MPYSYLCQLKPSTIHLVDIHIFLHFSLIVEKGPRPKKKKPPDYYFTSSRLTVDQED